MNSVIEFIITALYWCYFIGDDFVFTPTFFRHCFLVIVHVFSIAFIVFDLPLAIAILPALKFLTTSYWFGSTRTFNRVFFTFFSSLREDIRFENSLHNEKFHSGQHTGWTNRGMLSKHPSLDIEPALHILSKKLLNLCFFLILPEFDEFIYCFYRIVTKFINHYLHETDKLLLPFS